MTDPRRLIDETDDRVERMLLREARSYRASSSVHHGALTALGLVSTAVTVAKTSAAAGATWTMKAWFVAGVLVGVTATGVAVLTTRTEAPPTPQAPAAVAPRSEPKLQTRAPRPESAPVASPESSAPEPEAPAAPTVAERPRPSSTTPAKELPPASTLTEEVAALDAAQTALQSGNPGRALRLLDAHAARFPRGRLRLEAEVVRIEALAKAGNRAAAAARARSFLARFPNSVLAPRVRRYAGR